MDEMTDMEEEKARCASLGSLEDVQAEECCYSAEDLQEDNLSDEDQSEQRMMNVMADFRQKYAREEAQ